MNFISNLLGISMKHEPWDKEQQLPYLILDTYNIESVYFDQLHSIFLYPKTELPQVQTIKKHIILIQKIEHVPVVLALTHLNKTRREYLINSHIPFVVKESQIYLPFLAVVLQERFNKEKVSVEKLQPSAQLLFLFFLYNNKSKLYMNNAIKALKITAMTISRSVKQLEGTGLFFTKKEGVQKVIFAKFGRKELFQHMKPFLINPVNKRIFIHIEEVKMNLLYSGETALSKLSMLNSPIVHCHAIESTKGKHLTGTKQLIDSQNQVCVELWKYNPWILAKDTIVDPLSLALSFKDVVDERIEQAVEEIICKELEEINDNRD